ncbi:type II toxin-antitoxin system VapC family toxin [Pararhizobium sp.]|uniref:type II toxin-antitoxin system VapC family toxin n=1 Tax=Pararhizobium sp. TaxID=1977563 RepID=UPI0027186CD7|nr:type II toxin-antitoxin system VapC family toxin [Pararhizobium sp.]MDO9415190.1 type II toxin-antitoxin system VapC family toxin [Pararhizobium sp.]
MLDTNVISALVYEPRGKVFQKVIEVGEDNVFTSIFVHAEIWYGVKKWGSDDLATKVANVTRRMYVASFAMPGDRIYADIRLALRKGQDIGSNDMWIAGHALALDAVLVTANEDEFSRVPGLKVENWLH